MKLLQLNKELVPNRTKFFHHELEPYCSADHYTVVILINATALMHKAILSTNNFGNNHFGQKYQKKILLEFLADYNDVCWKKFQRIELKLKNAFLAKFSILLRIS